MATRLDTYDFDAPSSMTRGAKATYPWDEWLDGDIWRLVQGEDFQPHPLMMERIIRTRATGRGVQVEIRHEPQRDKAIASLIRALKAQAKISPEKEAQLLTKAAEALAESGGPFGAIVLHRLSPPPAKKAPVRKTTAVKPEAPKPNGKVPSKRPVKRRLAVAK
jgi:hypothetical protein